MYELFTLLVCTKEEFDAFKEVDLCKATAPTKVERKHPHPIFLTEKDHSFKISEETSSPSFDNFLL